MIKTYTEQWRDGNLPVGSYYIKLVGDVERIDFFEGLEWERTKDFGIEEVLGPVPHYMDCKGLIYDSINLTDARKRIDELVSKTEQLEKKLAIATKALKEIDVRSQRDWNEYDCMGCAKKALYDIEMEGVK